MKTKLFRYTFRWLLVPCLLTAASCKPVPPPAPPPVAVIVVPLPPPEVKKIRIEANIKKANKSIDYYEKNRKELIQLGIESRDATVDDETILERSISTNDDELGTLKERIQLTQKAIDVKIQQRNIDPELAAPEEIKALEHELKDLQRRETRAREEKKQDAVELAEVRRKLGRIRNKNEEEIFEIEMDRLYRQAIEHYLELYQLLIDETRQAMISSTERDALIKVFSRQIEKLSKLIKDDAQVIVKELFDTARLALKQDVSITVGFLSGHIFRLEFRTGDADLEPTAQQKNDFETIANALREPRFKNFGFLVFIDGHADTQQFEGIGECRSSVKNKDLSKKRATSLRDYLVREYRIDRDIIFLDWHGNFFLRVQPGGKGDAENQSDEKGEPDNRRAELRITTVERGQYTSHRDYFSIRNQLKWRGRIFKHQNGRWEDHDCAGKPLARTIAYRTEKHAKLDEEMKLLDLSALSIKDENREVFFSLGNDFVIKHNNVCVAVRGCS